ncbi:MAG: permease, partial [Alphaproteobacteria bacterium]
QMRRALGRAGPREIAIATLAGAASSSCSYASAAIMRTLFKKGASFVASIAFLFASTNLVLELGIILYLLLGWQFTLAEWIGGLVLITVLSLLVKATLPAGLTEEARSHKEQGGGHEHMSMTVEGGTWRERLASRETQVRVAQNFAMDWQMLWKDLAAGFLIGGFLTVFVPDSVWQGLFLTHASPWVRLPADALIGPIVAMLTFVCSIGNVPLAAVLWGGGASFGGVVAFLFADLIVLPLLDIYRRYYGWRMAFYMGAVFYAAMAGAALIVDLGFTALGIVPHATGGIEARVGHFEINYTFWLNLAALALAIWLFILNRRNPMEHGQDHGGGKQASRT